MMIRIHAYIHNSYIVIYNIICTSHSIFNQPPSHPHHLIPGWTGLSLVVVIIIM